MMDLKRLLRGDLRIEDRGPNAYVWSSFAHYGVRALFKKPLKRDTNKVMDEYNHQRDEYWKPAVTPDEYIWGDSGHERWVLIDHKLVRGNYRQVRERLLPRLGDRVAHYSKPGDLIVEFGAGTGRNLAYLARELPDRRYLGFELTPRSVEDARRMLEACRVKVEMRVADVTKPVPLDDKAAVAYSIQALEQLPGTRSRDALQQMATVARNAIVCFEPIRELFPRTIRGYTARLRQYRADYLDGLPAHARDLGLRVANEQLLGLAEHPLNELSELLVELG